MRPDRGNQTQSRGRYAPFSGQPSARLRLVSGYLLGSAILSALFLFVGLLTMLFGKPATPVPISVRLANFAIHATLAGGWSIAGVLIGRALRIGGILALVMFLIPLAGAVVFGLPVPRLSLVVAVVGVGLTLSVFNELK